MLTGTTTSGEDPRPATEAAFAANAAESGQEGLAQPPALATRFASTPRGAQFARRLAVRRMREWGFSPLSDASCTVALVVGELAANAVQHGRVRGHVCRLRLVLDTVSGLVRIEVCDAAATRRPPMVPPSSSLDCESGRGLLLVDILSVRWGSTPRHPVGKTIWAEVSTRTSAVSAT
ncbi:ATP-binding protein [Streptomyces sp. 549]|uniref:ATP-binding protein n=1 Tax=Streptomyces sp. 549 TaxID=3049076 RepID=UPI0024C3957B|nr:ATP-binding protein [Streptomyces sp. 549]MDK1475520.1 ATP-binding protein [Streptomyces sp. 549]